ncbi:Gfo/Idh/MocA family oxidoreductase [Clostridium estertheticum]|uniref:Gfo/Idh/MocA family protein n=1 Tax=Clostridium estertheticum TaxID=238834 RepID=UPI001C0D1236|nr:Gfo/Idh/MocA family oxidoreductase [Clostridium estertheticum]MBU3216359.1 Gfo/Idh/MocA family oxidoreductase [Clostridium estertheticum]WAG55410.1 Gfo/Idh/MocA family oxidoreductase [Clostridium estertheticum]
MDKKLRVGIIGCGGIANGKHMPSLAKIAEIEMVAFCDIIIEKAEIAAKEYGSIGAKVYTDYKELLKDDTIDVVHVCTPNRSHSSITIDVLEAGKHIMCEKPMAKTSLEAREMLEAAKRTGKKLTIGYQNRFRADSRYLKTTCENGGLGDIYFAKAHAIRRRAVPTWGVFLNEFEQDGGPLIDIGTHALDLTLWMLDNYKPKYVVGNVYHKLSKKENAANAWGPWEPSKFTVEDSAFGFITMENGATIVVESSWALNSLEVGEAQTSLCGTEGGADMKDGLRINGENLGRLYETKVDFGSNGVAFNEGISEEPADAEARSWIDCILNDKQPIVKPEQALVVTEILEAIYESSKTGEPVYFNK